MVVCTAQVAYHETGRMLFSAAGAGYCRRLDDADHGTAPADHVSSNCAAAESTFIFLFRAFHAMPASVWAKFLHTFRAQLIGQVKIFRGSAGRANSLHYFFH